MQVSQLLQQVDALGAEILKLHPELCLESWSHSLGEVTPFDGWTAGFVLRGLKFELELAVDLMHIHRQPQVARIVAEWLNQGEGRGFVWVDFLGKKPFEDGRQAVLQAVARGVPDGFCLGATATHVVRAFPEPRVKSSLTPDERSVYNCWLENHRTITPMPPHLVDQTDSFGLFPKTEEARDRLARLLGTSPEVVRAAFPEAIVPPELLRPSVVTVNLSWQVEDYRLWRHLYRQKPLCSGLICLSPIGFVGNRAAMLVVRYCGTNIQDMLEDDAVDTGVTVVSFEKLAGAWTILDTQPVSWRVVMRTFYTGPLFLVTDGWAELTQVELTGEFFQPTLDLTWSLPTGGEQRLRVVPGEGQCDAETLYVRFTSPESVLEAVQKHFKLKPPDS